MRKHHPNTAELERQVATWNATYPEGTKVLVRLDSGAGYETTTRSPAWIIGGHSALVSVVGISGGYSLERVTPITTPMAESISR